MPSIFLSACVFLASEEREALFSFRASEESKAGFSWQTANRMSCHKKFCNQEDGCLHLILELLLKTINVLSDFI
jgi:hypothetical protein